MSFMNTEVLPHIGGWFRPLIGRDPYNKKSVEDHQKAALEAVHVLEQHFLVHTYFVGERITLADIFGVSLIARGFQYLFDKQWREQNPNTTRWYETVSAQPIWRAVMPEVIMIDEAIKYVPPKKEAKPAKPQPAAQPKAQPKAEKPAKHVEEEEEEEEAKPEPKPKHPLEALPKPSLILDDWKRKYSNEDTRSVALPWFWEHYKPSEYSLWRIDYKYNDELTKVFMSSNLIGTSKGWHECKSNPHLALSVLICSLPSPSSFPFPSFSLPHHVSQTDEVSSLAGGFFNRLEASRKYLFGSCSVYGLDNDSIIQGAFMVRGGECMPAFDVAPDWESYEFTKLDPTKTADKEFVEDQWAWDKPASSKEGKTYAWADGKVFK